MFEKNSIIRIINKEGKFLGHGMHTHPTKENSTDATFVSAAAKSNIAHNLRFFKNSIYINEFLNETIIEYELIEKRRIPMREYLQKAGKL